MSKILKFAVFAEDTSMFCKGNDRAILDDLLTRYLNTLARSLESATTRDGEVKQRQHFYHHGDTICHPRSGYVTTKLHGTSTCRCNNNAIFSDRAIFTFPTVAVCQPR